MEHQGSFIPPTWHLQIARRLEMANIDSQATVNLHHTTAISPFLSRTRGSQGTLGCTLAHSRICQNEIQHICRLIVPLVTCLTGWPFGMPYVVRLYWMPEAWRVSTTAELIYLANKWVSDSTPCPVHLSMLDGGSCCPVLFSARLHTQLLLRHLITRSPPLARNNREGPAAADWLWPLTSSCDTSKLLPRWAEHLRLVWAAIFGGSNIDTGTLCVISSCDMTLPGFCSVHVIVGVVEWPSNQPIQRLRVQRWRADMARMQHKSHIG